MKHFSPEGVELMPLSPPSGTDSEVEADLVSVIRGRLHFVSAPTNPDISR